MSTATLERASVAAASRHLVSSRPLPARPLGRRSGEAFDDLAAVFPSRRLGCGAATPLTRRRTAGFDARASVTAWLIGEGLSALDPDSRRRIIDRWHAYRDHGPRLVGDNGCDIRLGRAAVDAAERAALLLWLPLTERELAVYDGGLFEDAPAHAIALLVRPPTIWALDEAIEAERRFPRRGRIAPERFATIERLAHEWTGDEHLRRVRRAVARIADQLPAPGLPVASATVLSGCARVAADDADARAVAA